VDIDAGIVRRPAGVLFHMIARRPPKGVLVDYGGTLVEEVRFDSRSGNEALLARAAFRPEHVALEHVLARATRISEEVAIRRDECQLETPWPTLTRLIHDFLGIRFADPMPDLEMAYWKAAVTTEPMPGAREALEEFHRRGVPIGVVSNCAFGPEVVRYELGKHGLSDHLMFVMVSAEYSVRKPNTLLFETAAAKLGVASEDIWFVGDRLDTDVAGAKAAGMKAIWFHSPNTASADRADLTVANWTDLMDCFQTCLVDRQSLAYPRPQSTND
jgi:HAD superfamily hydrolase (TIGR01662 family)